jgi:hypothetical protein
MFQNKDDSEIILNIYNNFKQHNELRIPETFFKHYKLEKCLTKYDPQTEYSGLIQIFGTTVSVFSNIHHSQTFDSIYNMRFKLFREYDEYTYEGGDALLIDNVFNLVTKPKCYHKPRYEAVREALETMKDIMVMNATTKLAMPKISCGLDKLSWDEVLKIIQEVFEDTNVEILICELN